MRQFLLFILAIFCFSEFGFAQKSREHVSLGFGPAVIYGENTGDFGSLKFRVPPAISFSYNKQLSHQYDLRYTIGTQILNSGGYEDINSPTVIHWSENGQAFDFTGMAYFADIMPVYQFNPNLPQRVGDVANFYAGLGLGVMFVARKEDILSNPGSSTSRVETSRNSTIAAYIPLRIGVSSNLDFQWDYALEFSALTATNSEIDGNNLKNKLIKPDILFQFQVKVKRYIRR